MQVEYLLHVQELLASHKSELLLAGATMQQKGERLRSRYMWQRNALLQTRHDLKQARKVSSYLNPKLLNQYALSRWLRFCGCNQYILYKDD